MLDSLFRYGFLGALAVAALVWAIVLIRAWAPRARARGGFWYLEAVLLLSGPVLETLIFLYPEDLSGPVPTVARVVSLACMALALWAMLQSSTNARRGTGTIVAAVVFYYLTLIMSGIVGATPGIPEQYLTTPLLLLAFLIHGGFSVNWFISRVTFNLRIIIIFSLASALFLPSLAFNTVEPRTLFGVERLEGITAHPNTLGAVAVIAIIFEMRKPSSKLWLLFPLLALTFAQSNTAWIALVLAIAVQRSHLGMVLRFAAVAAAVLASGAILFSPNRANAVIDTLLGDDVTFNGRTRIWDAAMIGFREFPTFGYGPTLLDDGYRARHLPNFDAAAQAHNQVVQSLAGAGVAGLIAFLILVIVLLKRSNKLRRLGDTTALSLLIAVLIRAFAETPFRPTGAGLATFILISVLVYIAVSSAERSTVDSALGKSPAVPAKRKLGLVGHPA